jgi:hypothetical protein
VKQVLVLAEPGDAGAAAVADLLQARLGSDALLWLTPRQLGLARRWVHTVDAEGQTRTRFETSDGVPITDDTFAAVVNRVGFTDPVRFLHAPPKDRDYATMELSALVWSWLAALRVPVLNRPMARRSAAWWLAAARGVGLPVALRSVTAGPDARAAALPAADQEVVVTGEQAHGMLAQQHGPACVRLAARTGHPLLACRFATGDGRPLLVAVDPLPELTTSASRSAAADFVEAIVRLRAYP